VVAGSAALAGGGTLTHPVMARSLNVTGSLLIDVAGLRLDGRFISSTGAVLDSFTVLKGAPVGVGALAPSALSLRLAGPNPTTRDSRLAFRLPEAGPVRLTIIDPSGRRVATLVNQSLPAGDHHATWNGLTERGPRAGAGVYMAMLEMRRESRTVKLVRR
jgi:hypothetical protein